MAPAPQSAPRSGDAPEAGAGAQLLGRRASRHHAPAAAAPRRGPRLSAAAGECPPRPPGRVSAGKPHGRPIGSGAVAARTRGWEGAQGRELGLPLGVGGESRGCSRGAAGQVRA